MADITAILAGIQDEATKKILVELNTKAEKQEADTKSLADLQASMAGKTLVENKTVEGWKSFTDKGGLDRDKQLEDRNKVLEAEVAKLKPEAEKVAILQAQIDGNAIDPNKILALAEEKFKDRFLTPEKVTEIQRKAVEEARHQVDFGSIPTGLALLELQNRIRGDFNKFVPLTQISEMTTRAGGNIETAYLELTKADREAKAVADAKAAKEKYDSDIAAAEKRGADKARLAFETNQSFEEAGGGPAAVLPMAPVTKEGEIVVNAQTYDPTQGTLAREGFRKLQSGEYKDQLANFTQ